MVLPSRVVGLAMRAEFWRAGLADLEIAGSPPQRSVIPFLSSWPGFVPAIHVLLACRRGMMEIKAYSPQIEITPM
jgi:hypothetical protein